MRIKTQLNDIIQDLKQRAWVNEAEVYVANQMLCIYKAGELTGIAQEQKRMIKLLEDLKNA